MNLKMRILSVDDSQDTCEMLAVMLTLQGHEVQISTTVAEAKWLITLGASDLYILDMRFPDGDGVELCRWIRINNPESTVLFYTGSATDAQRVAALNAGAAAFLTKPLTESLLSTVEAHLAATR